jgi:hypothetical protein
MASKTKVTEKKRRRKAARIGKGRKREINKAGGTTPSRKKLFGD